MPRGDYRQRIACADQPCPESVTYHHQTRADEAASARSQRERPWKCSRHLHPEEVLGPGQEALTGIMTVTARPGAQHWEPSLIWVGWPSAWPGPPAGRRT